jgi:3-methyladenine DNA glycosylase/8-oxoguanine DNA glycosylase
MAIINVSRRKEAEMMQPIILEHTFEMQLSPCPPFHFEGTFCKPSYFPTHDILNEPGRYWQSMRFQGQVFGISMEDQGTYEEPCITLTIYSIKALTQGEINAISSELTFRFNLAADISDFARQFEQDDILGPALTRWRGMRPSSNVSLYEYLVLSTVLQNATVRRTVQMHDNLTERYGSQVMFDGKCLTAYWPPEAIAAASEEELRMLKVGYRAKGLKRQAEMFAAGEMDEFALRSLPGPELKQTLLNIYGIGPASVWYLLFGVFKRYDAFEYISPWEQKIFSRLLFDQKLVDAKQILAYADQRWGKWKMLAAHYMFEDLFWQRKNQSIPWLEDLIRL